MEGTEHKHRQKRCSRCGDILDKNDTICAKCGKKVIIPKKEVPKQLYRHFDN